MHALEGLSAIDGGTLRNAEWAVCAKRPFGGPEAVLSCLSRYTHRVVIADIWLIALGDAGPTFKWKARSNNHQRAVVV